MKIWIPIVLALALGGCTAVAGKVGAVLLKPVSYLVAADATTTNKWIDREVAAGRLTAAEESLARQCPSAVLAMAKLRDRAAGEGEDDIKGFKGLIYHGVRGLFAKSLQEEATLHVRDIMDSCGRLIPAEKLLWLL